MSELVCSEIEELLAASALEALEPEERAMVIAHLETCPGCRARYAEYASVAESLLYSVPLATPPRHVKRSLMAAVRPQPAGVLESISTWLSGAFRLPRWSFSAAVAAVVLATALLGWRTYQLSTERAQLLQALEAVAGPGSRSIGMVGTEVATGGSGNMVYDPAGNLAVVKVQQMPALPASQSYQLWLIRPDGKRDSGAVFNMAPGPHGSMTFVVSAPRLMAEYTGCGVSIEPAGGSPQPTGPTALAGKIWY